MVRTSYVIVVLSLLACACAPGNPFSQAIPMPGPTSTPAMGIAPKISIRYVAVRPTERALTGPDEVPVQKLPLYPLLASASAEEWQAVGLSRETAFPAMEKSLWRLHRHVTVSELPKGETEWKVRREGAWPKLNISFLSAASGEIGTNNINPENLPDYEKKYHQGVLDGVMAAGDIIFDMLGMEQSWSIYTGNPKVGEGNLAVFAVRQTVSYSMPTWSTSPLVEDLFDIKDVVAGGPSGFYPTDVQSMESRGFPQSAINRFIEQRYTETVLRELFTGLGIEAATPSPYVVMVTATTSIDIGDIVSVTIGLDRQATGSHVVTSNDTLWEDGGNTYIQTSSEQPGEDEERRVLSRAARIVAKKLKGSVTPKF